MSGAASQAVISQYMRGGTQEQMIRRRDAAGKEMELLAKTMHDQKPNAEEVTSYIRGLLQKQHIPAEEGAKLLVTVPHDPEALRAWARSMFAFVMHQGIHAHAAFPRSEFPAPQEAPAPQEPAEGAAQPPQPPQGA